ncbi:3'(2'),5'-bisphosphate nucleotidase CysQ [Muriicola sp. Z0-33]|uniref:3'(2'),5'-bisphosphate nucleotidase CysQ n=1 Tax=Muriicola sp. Z0-33 TaxID=2816957 RepID=UPI0022387835|nr:3'(2'),5'-bisphosphate nucleotidase CysQ [Muriicola sp. Z0-33]MCW5515581.1 3'(2'),5'-bisphosphate nucleotidase CysQ [Muriicola sp. Z0-33]
MKSDLRIAITASINAGKAIMKIYDADQIKVDFKEDKSPLTEADLASNSCIMSFLKDTPYPVISEENKLLDYDLRKSWSDYWIVDPLDGTKEFIKRNGEFTVNVALCSKGQPVLGVIYVPVERTLYYGDALSGEAFKTVLDKNHSIDKELFSESDRIKTANISKELIRVVASRSHMNQDTVNFIEGINKDYKDVEIVSAGSSLKFCLVAEGKADVYPRFAPTMEWDTAAGHAICKAVGIKVISRESNKELEYNKSNLLNPHFLVSN